VRRSVVFDDASLDHDGLHVQGIGVESETVPCRAVGQCGLSTAKTRCDTEPAVQAGRLVVELHPWYSATGIRTDPPKAP
jgi:hypothetical protein